MIKAEIEARRSQEIERYKGLREKKQAARRLRTKQQALFSFKKVTTRVNENIEKEAKQIEEETLKLFTKQGLIKNAGALAKVV